MLDPDTRDSTYGDTKNEMTFGDERKNARGPAMDPETLRRVGVVAIGRNEGERLRKCLESVSGRNLTIVYVDSGSTDGSIDLARSLGADVVILDLSRPFTAARARNEGFARLIELVPDISYVQFVDGDCEFADRWLERARETLEARPEVAVVCGRLRERARDHSIYNRLADIEWDTPIGELGASGGISMMRAEVFRAVGGFNPAIIAAEDDEICLRIRRLGRKILRIDADMASHDMAMTRFSQWWRRSVRTGHAYAEGVVRHGRSPDRHFVSQLRSVLFWGLVLPSIALVLAWPTRGASFLLLLGYPWLFMRIRRHARRRELSEADSRLFAFACVLAKFPQLIGAAQYWLGRIVGSHSRIIEYK